MYIKPIDKEEAKTIKWLHSGCCRNPARPVLNGIHIKGGFSYSADGYKLMRIKAPESLKEYEGLTIKPLSNIPVTPQVVEWEELVDYTYPDCEQIINTDKEEVFQFSVDKKLLADAIKTMPGPDNNMITLSFTGERDPIRITTDDALLVVMPMKKE